MAQTSFEELAKRYRDISERRPDETLSARMERSLVIAALDMAACLTREKLEKALEPIATELVASFAADIDNDGSLSIQDSIKCAQMIRDKCTDAIISLAHPEPNRG